LFSIFVAKYPLFFEIESIEQFIHDFVVLIEKYVLCISTLTCSILKVFQNVERSVLYNSCYFFRVKERPEVELWILQCFKSLVLASDVFMKQQHTNLKTHNSRLQ
jgi:hypothetical protein